MEKINRKKLKIIKCGKGIVYLGEVFNEKCHGRGALSSIQESLYFRMAGFIKVSSKITLGKAKGSTFNQMDRGILESFRMTRKTAVDCKSTRVTDTKGLI